MKTLGSILLMVFISATLQGQHLQKHQWKQRLILLVADTEKSSPLQQQLDLLKAYDTSLQERKIVIYRVFPNGYYRGLHSKELIVDRTLYSNLHTTSNHFELVLKGLDGATKMQESKVIDPTLIFQLIDRMPMRKQELRNTQD